MHTHTYTYTHACTCTHAHRHTHANTHARMRQDYGHVWSDIYYATQASLNFMVILLPLPPACTDDTWESPHLAS